MCDFDDSPDRLVKSRSHELSRTGEAGTRSEIIVVDDSVALFLKTLEVPLHVIEIRKHHSVPSERVLGHDGSRDVASPRASAVPAPS